MSKLKVFKFELKKLFSDKLLIIAALVLFAMIFALLAITYESDTVTPPESYDKAEIIEGYKKSVNHYNELLKTNLKDYERENYETELKKLTFFIENNKTEYDLIQFIRGDYFRLISYKSLGFPFYAFEIFYYIFIALSIIFPFYIFFTDNYKSRIKNVLAGRLKRKDVFLQKTLFSLAIPLILFFIASIVLIIIGLFSQTSNALVYLFGQFSSVSYINLLLANLIGLMVTMLFTGILSIAATTLFKNFNASIIIPVIFWAFMFLLMIIILESSFATGSIDSFYLKIIWIPIMNIYQFSYFGFNIYFILILLLHLALAAAFYFIARKKFIRQDF